MWTVSCAGVKYIDYNWVIILYRKKDLHFVTISKFPSIPKWNMPDMQFIMTDIDVYNGYKLLF